MITFSLYDEDGAPLEGSAPSFAAYVDAAGQAQSPPAMEDLGGGMFRFATEPEVAYLIDGGEDAAPRYLSGSTGELVAVAFFDEDGDPWSGEPPAFDHYDGEKPELVSLAAGLWGWVPSRQEQRARVSYRIAAPEGAEPAFYTGTVPPLLTPSAVGPTVIWGRGTVLMKSGDTLPTLDAQIVEAGGKPVDLSGWIVRVVGSRRPGQELTIDAEADVVDAKEGRFKYDWQPGDLEHPGVLYLEAQIFDGAGRRMTLPGGGRGIVIVEKGLKP